VDIATKSRRDSSLDDSFCSSGSRFSSVMTALPESTGVDSIAVAYFTGTRCFNSSNQLSTTWI
jgi:hypothetical protein